jgi:hypothetical protein
MSGSPVAWAQGTSVVTGIVRDVSGRPLPGAAVVIDPENAPIATQTDRDGRFRIERVSSGTHRLRVSWIGYVPDDRVIDVRESSVNIEIVLEPLAYQLDTVSIIARRGGIIGRVHTSVTRTPVRGASVEVLGARWRMRTDSTGLFEFGDIPEGGYVIQVRRDGYKTRTIPAHVPAAGAVELVASMDSIMTDRDKRFENRLRDMETRIHRRTANDFALIARPELTIRPGILLDEALRYAPSAIRKGFILLSGFVCEVYIDGVPDRIVRLKDLRAEQIATIEVYRANGCAEEVPYRGQMTRVIRPQGKPGYFAYIWLKR